MSTKILMLPGNSEFNSSLQGYLEKHYPHQQDFVHVNTSMFASGEMHAQMRENVRGGNVFVVQSSSGSWTLPSNFQTRVQTVVDTLDFLNNHSDERIREAAQKLALNLAGIEIASGINSSSFEIFLARQYKRSVNDDFMMLVATLDALKRTNTGSIQAVLPFLPYQRQDRKDKPRVPITAKAIFDILKKVGGDEFKNIITSELHVPQAQGFSDGPVDNLPMTWVIAADILETIKKHNIDPNDVILVSPDLGGEKRVEAVLDVLGAHLGTSPHIAVFKKTRLQGQETEHTLLVPHGEKFTTRGKIAFMVDDIMDSGNSSLTPAQILKKMRVKKVYQYITHGVLTEGAAKSLLDPAVDGVVVTNSLPVPPYMLHHIASGKLSQLGVHPFFGEVITANATEGSVSGLFDINAVRAFAKKGGIPLGDHLKF